MSGRVAGGTRRPTRPTWRRPAQQLYDELDRFHLPREADSTWGEWHYFNVVTGPDEWWYVTYLVGGAVSLTPAWAQAAGAAGCSSPTAGRTARYDRFTADVPGRAVRLDTTRGRLAHRAEHRPPARRCLPPARARHRRRRTPSGSSSSVRPLANRYFPPVELRDDEFLSGYVVPASPPRRAARICVARALPRVDRRAGLPRPQLGRLAGRDLGVGRRRGRHAEPALWRGLRPRASRR